VVAFSVQRVLSHHEDQALLKAYIAEWRKFFTQCDYLPTPFRQLESSLAGKTVSVQKKAQNDESIVRKVRIIAINYVFYKSYTENDYLSHSSA
jgi:cullin-5